MKSTIVIGRYTINKDHFQYSEKVGNDLHVHLTRETIVLSTKSDIAAFCDATEPQEVVTARKKAEKAAAEAIEKAAAEALAAERKKQIEAAEALAAEAKAKLDELS